MRKIRGPLAVLIAFLLILGLVPDTFINTYALTLPVNVYNDEYDDGTLTIRWDNLQNVLSVVITYHELDGTLTTVAGGDINIDERTATISGLSNDYIYDIDVKLYDEPEGAGELIGHGMLYFIPKITFYSTQLEQDYMDLDGGSGRETGHEPGLNLKWVMPKVWDGSDYTYVNDNLDYMETQLNDIYDDRVLDTLNFRINISTEAANLNDSPSQSSLLINSSNNNQDYTVNVSGNETETAEVLGISAEGVMEFDLLGRKDIESEPKAAENVNQLRDWDILPGSAYYMNIKPVFRDDEDSNVNALMVGDPSSHNGSGLDGQLQYTYTPLRFQLSKDSANNLYVRIYKINQGSLDLPQLYYEVQASDDPSVPGDWKVKRTLDDSYFSGDFAITVITGTNPNNEIFYKIVVKSNSVSDRLESPSMPYTLSEDTSRPPVVSKIAPEERFLNIQTVENPTTGLDEQVKATDIQLSWDKPANWDEIKDDLYFHIMLSTSQADMDDTVELYHNESLWGEYIPQYRLVNYVSAISPNIEEVGNRLVYRLNSFDLYKWEDENGDLYDFPAEQLPDDDYPDFLFPNTIYYIQMYSALEENKGSTDILETSDRSVVASFTTIAGFELDVPIPKNFRLNTNLINESTELNEIQLQFEPIDIDWDFYLEDTTVDKEVVYDLYISDKTAIDSFIRIGTTDLDEDAGDVAWFFSEQDEYIQATISEFSSISNQDVVNRFGYSLRPNTTYYYILKTRLVVEDITPDRESDPTAILPVTTVKKKTDDPSEGIRMPLAPADFKLALDTAGNQKLTGSSAVFDWTRKETDVTYQFAIASENIDANTEIETLLNDDYYSSFIDVYGGMDADSNDNIFTLDPQNNSIPLLFTYTQSTEKYNLTIDKWLSPNKLYYVAVRAVLGDLKSIWVSLPVTTSLIEAPHTLEALVDPQLAFYWQDDLLVNPEDYVIEVKKSTDEVYNTLTRSQASIIRDSGIFYLRLYRLEPKTKYDVKVSRNEGQNVLLNVVNQETINKDYQINIAWSGPSGNEYEIAIKTENDEDYIKLTSADTEQYINANGSIRPFYTEKTPLTLDTLENRFYAKILTIPVHMNNGLTAHVPLKSNTKYYIKVRSKKEDASDTTIISYSKYVGPVSTRTEFNQEDYDEEDRKVITETYFMDKIDMLERGLYWRLDTKSSLQNKLLLKAARVKSQLENLSSNKLVLDISGHAQNIRTDIIYIPYSVFESIEETGNSIEIKTTKAVYLIKPGMIDIFHSNLLNDIRNKPDVNNILFELKIQRQNSAGSGLPENTQLVSDINDFEVIAAGNSYTDEDILFEANDRLYSNEDGLLKDNIEAIEGTYLSDNTDSNELVKNYIELLIAQIEQELSEYLYNTLESGNNRSSEKNIEKFNKPIGATLQFETGEDIKNPYILYDDATDWHKISGFINKSYNEIYIDVYGTGKYAILSIQATIYDLPDSYDNKSGLMRLMQKYSVEDIFPGIETNFAPDNPVNGEEIVEFITVILGYKDDFSGMTARQKLSALDFEIAINPYDIRQKINREQLAYILGTTYTKKTSIDVNNLIIGGLPAILDEDEISDYAYNQVLFMLDRDIMTLTDGYYFSPKNKINRLILFDSTLKLLDLIGEFSLAYK
jgi:hypothetical protein